MSSSSEQVVDLNTYADMTSDEQVSQFFEMAQQYRELLRDIFVMVPVRPMEGISVQLARALTMWYGEGCAWAPLEDHMGGFIEQVRARMAKIFVKKHDEKYLLMIDNDMQPPLTLPMLLGRHEQAVVGGCCMSVGEHGPMLCFSRQDSAGVYRFPTLKYLDAIPRTGLLDVAHVGTGAILIRRDVLESFSFEKNEKDIPFFIPEEIRARGFAQGQLLKGEDIVFCNQVRDKGFKIHVDLEAHVGHRKTMNMFWPDAKRSDALSAETWLNAPFGMRFGLTND